MGYYAGRLCISTKYLNSIVRKMAFHSTKSIIDQFVTLQLKQTLRTTAGSISEIATDFNFDDSAALCRYFRHNAGQTAQNYRRTNKFTARPGREKKEKK